MTTETVGTEEVCHNVSTEVEGIALCHGFLSGGPQSSHVKWKPNPQQSRTVLRRSGIGVAVGLVVFAILRLGLEKGVRPLIETRRFVAEAVLPPFTPQSGILIQEGFLPLHQLVPKSGQGFSISSVCQSSVQAPSGGADPRFTNCLRQHGLHFVVEYIPNSSYWSAQVLELSVCVVMFVLAVVASRWMLSRVDV